MPLYEVKQAQVGDELRRGADDGLQGVQHLHPRRECECVTVGQGEGDAPAGRRHNLRDARVALRARRNHTTDVGKGIARPLGGGGPEDGAVRHAKVRRDHEGAGRRGAACAGAERIQG